MRKHSREFIIEKMTSTKIKATTYLTGTKKNAFMLDCLKRDTYECALLREIVNLHYSIMEVHKDWKDKEFDEIKKLILEKTKVQQ
jgi:hypothetical protein